MRMLAAALLYLLLVTTAALAQPVTVIGPVTPGNVPVFNSTTVIKDSGFPPGGGGGGGCTGLGAFQVGTGAGVQCSTTAGSVGALSGGPFTVTATGSNTAFVGNAASGQPAFTANTAGNGPGFVANATSGNGPAFRAIVTLNSPTASPAFVAPSGGGFVSGAATPGLLMPGFVTCTRDGANGTNPTNNQCIEVTDGVSYALTLHGPEETIYVSGGGAGFAWFELPKVTGSVNGQGPAYAATLAIAEDNSLRLMTSANSFNVAGKTGHPNPPVASFSGSIAGTTLTVSSVSAGLVAYGQVISCSGCAAGTIIIGATGSPAGGPGAYTVSPSQTVAGPIAMTATLATTGPFATATGIAQTWGLYWTYFTNNAFPFLPDGNQAQVFPGRSPVTINFNIGSGVASNIMNVYGLFGGKLLPGDKVCGSPSNCNAGGVATNTFIVTQLDGTIGGVGNYLVSISQLVAITGGVAWHGPVFNAGLAIGWNYYGLGDSDIVGNNLFHAASSVTLRFVDFNDTTSPPTMTPLGGFYGPQHSPTPGAFFVDLGIAGVAGQTDACVGCVGEILQAETFSGVSGLPNGSVNLTAGLWTQIVQVVLTAGDWDVSGSAGFCFSLVSCPQAPLTNGNVNLIATSIDFTVGQPASAAQFAELPGTGVFNLVNYPTVSVGPRRFSCTNSACCANNSVPGTCSASTTIRLNAFCGTNGVSPFNCAAYGSLRARRMR